MFDMSFSSSFAIAIRVDDELEDCSLDQGHDCLHDLFRHEKRRVYR
jgi:hypothetical protein